MVFFLALRNIIKNKKDSAIITILIAVIIFLFFIGNSITQKADQNIRLSFNESLTGDVVLQRDGDVSMNLFGANTPVIDLLFSIPVLPAYNAVMDILSEEEDIAGITSQVSGMAVLDMLDVRDEVLLCGIDSATYFDLFPGIILEEGRFLQAGEYGAMLTAEQAQRIENFGSQRPEIGMPLLLTSGGTMGFKIREVPLVGVFRYQNPGQFMNKIIIIDPQTVRVLNSIQVAGFTDSNDISNDLLSFDIDDIFNDSFFIETENDDTEFSTDFLQQYLSESSPAAGGEETGGDWHFIIMRLKKGISVNSFISSLNQKVSQYGVTAVNWRIAAGNFATLVLLVQVLFNTGIFLVSVVGVIAIINILFISIFRRIREIGTLRAIGASSVYIRSLIYVENLIISLIAGVIGVLGGFLFLRWINSMRFNISNELIAGILNGSVLYIEFVPYTAIYSFFAAVFLGLIASVYPVETAVKLEPVVAVRRG